MRVYVAGSFSNRDGLAAVASTLRENGIDVTSSWLREPPLTYDDESEEWQKRARANEDMIDLERADLCLMDATVPTSTGGYYVELGMCLAHRKPVYLLGPKRNIFYWSNLVTEVASVEEFMEKTCPSSLTSATSMASSLTKTS